MRTPMFPMRITRIVIEPNQVSLQDRGQLPIRRCTPATNGAMAEGGNGDTLLTLISHSVEGSRRVSWPWVRPSHPF